MAENIAYCYQGDAAVASGTDYVNWFVQALNSVGSHYWEVTSSTSGKALLTCTATGAQVVLRGTAATAGNQGQVEAGLAPEGGVSDWSGTPTATVWSGMRTITSSTTLITLSETKCRLAEYEDSLLLVVGAESYWRVAMFIGCIFEPMDISDANNNIGRDGIMSGRPDDQAVAGYWLTGNTGAAYINTSMCVRTGSSFQLARTSVPVAAGNAVLDNIGTQQRLVPYQVHLLVISGLGPLVGTTKYLRQYKSNLYNDQTLESIDTLSQQAWIGMQEEGQASPHTNQVCLWSKTVQTI